MEIWWNFFFAVFSARSETRKGVGPLKLELQLQPSVAPQDILPIRGQPNQNIFIASTTPNPDPFETLKPNIDPALADAIYQQHRIRLQPTYSPLRDQNVVDPQLVSALLQQQFYNSQNSGNPGVLGFRQNADGSVSTYQAPAQNQNPFFNWFGGTNNNNNNQYQNDQQQQQQQGPIASLINNIATNNPITSFFNNLARPQQDQQQQQNPFQQFFTNLNPFNLFSPQNGNNNNRPMTPAAIQSDYVPTMTSVNNQLLSGNLDNGAFSNDHFLNPNQYALNYQQGQGIGNQLQTLNYPGVNNPSTIYHPNYQPHYPTTTGSPIGVYNPNYGHLTSTNRPFYMNNQLISGPENPQPYSQLFNRIQNPAPYPIYQSPFQTGSPYPVTRIPGFNNQKKKTHKSSKKKNDKNKVDLPDTESDWFQGFLDKRKEASLDVSSKRPMKKSSDEDDDDDLEDYFRWFFWLLRRVCGLH